MKQKVFEIKIEKDYLKKILKDAECYDQKGNLIQGKIDFVTEVSKMLLKSDHFISLTDTNQIYWFDGKVYNIQLADSYIGSAITKYSNLLNYSFTPTSQQRDMVFQRIKTAQTSLINRGDLDANPNLVCLENGVFSLSEKKLLPHSSDYLTSIKLPIIYDPNATIVGSKFEKFLNEIVEKPEDIKILQEFFGYIFNDKNIYEKILLLVGSGQNGKSVLLEVLRHFVGNLNVTSVILQSLKNRFESSKLYGKLLCFNVIWAISH